MKIELLALVAILAVYAQWRFASPFLPSPVLRHGSALVRHSPLLLFLLAGILMALALANFSRAAFVVALLASMTMMFGALALAYKLRA